MDMDLFARVRERLLDGTLWPLTEGNVLWNPVPSATRPSPAARASTRSPAR